MVEYACTLSVSFLICSSFCSHHVIFKLVEPLWKLQNHSSRSVCHQDFIRYVKIRTDSSNDELVISLSPHLGKYPGGLCCCRHVLCQDSKQYFCERLFLLTSHTTFMYERLWKSLWLLCWRKCALSGKERHVVWRKNIKCSIYNCTVILTW